MVKSVVFDHTLLVKYGLISKKERNFKYQYAIHLASHSLTQTPAEDSSNNSADIAENSNVTTSIL